MDKLKKRILEVGTVTTDHILNLDAILNHQVDPHLHMEIGQEFARLFQHSRIDKVLTIESSGIPLAFSTAYALNVPLVFARRKKSMTMNAHIHHERVPSFTKGIVSDIMVSTEYISENENILLIDDIIANGDVLRGLIRIVEKAKANLVGVGIVVEKTFQAGASSIRERGIDIKSLVQISSLADGNIHFTS